MKSEVWIAVLLVALLGTGQALAMSETLHRRFDVKSGGTLKLQTDLGAIRVTTTDVQRVEITIEARDEDRFREEFDVDFQHSGADVSVRVEAKRSWRDWGDIARRLKLRFDVVVPHRYNLDLRTAGGSIDVADLEGDIIARTSGGSLEFGDVKGRVEGKTSGGSVLLGRVEGPVSVYTSGGSISINRARGEVKARTSGGSIRVDEVYGAIDAHTSGGSITAHILEQPKTNCRLQTSGGSITVYLAPDIKLSVDAKTSGGRVYTDFPVSIQGEINPHALRVDINGGGPELYLRTSGGNIALKK